MTPKLQASGEVLVVYPHDTAVLEGSEEYAESMDLEDLKLSGDPTYFVIRPLSSYEWEEMQAAMMARAGRLAAKGDEDAFATSAIRLLYDAFERACVRIIRPDGEHLRDRDWETK